MNQRLCTKCHQEKPYDEFPNDKYKKSGKTSQCKTCRYSASSRWEKDNRLYRNQNVKQRKSIYPYKFVLKNIKQRCENPHNIAYEDYGGRGIKCLITNEEIKTIWFRDKACDMKRPSIDRKDNDGDYTMENCQFIELIENTVKNKRKDVNQYTLNGMFIKQWPSVISASQSLNIASGNIASCARGLLKQSNGFIWRYENDTKSHFYRQQRKHSRSNRRASSIS